MALLAARPALLFQHGATLSYPRRASLASSGTCDRGTIKSALWRRSRRSFARQHIDGVLRVPRLHPAQRHEQLSKQPCVTPGRPACHPYWRYHSVSVSSQGKVARYSYSLACRDRATYDANLQSAVNYTVATPADAPLSLTYGPSFFTLASQLKGQVTVGLNRQLNNQANSLAAGSRAKQSMGNLFAIELGNEPDCM